MQTRTFSRKGSSKVSRKASTDVGASLVKSGLVFAALKKYGMIDVIGLSISDAPNIREELWPIFFALDGEGQPTELLDAATIITNIEASVYLNNGLELVGDETIGYAQFIKGTSGAILRKEYRYFRKIYAPAGFQENDTIWMRENGAVICQEGYQL